MMGSCGLDWGLIVGWRVISFLLGGFGILVVFGVCTCIVLV